MIQNISNQTLITYPYFIAFTELINNMELIKKIYLTCSNNNPNTEISKGQFLREAQQFSQITPCEIHILFSLIKGFRADE